MPAASPANSDQLSGHVTHRSCSRQLFPQLLNQFLVSVAIALDRLQSASEEVVLGFDVDDLLDQFVGFLAL